MKKQSEYSAIEWARLFPDERYRAMQAENDASAGRNIIPVRGADGRSTVFIDRATGKQVDATSARRIGGLV
ncbi:hypothetical protein [Bradyrhizobium sp. LTSP885]|uniref:hypothetical protein n=1 Tax=Bradyrhizobium sp. LTSP885 TaxID=1619232 RepID=UPI000A5FE724|nr:hypothetical protein [Bradyrhizobium sp. LTSP885]